LLALFAAATASLKNSKKSENVKRFDGEKQARKKAVAKSKRQEQIRDELMSLEEIEKRYFQQ